MDLLGQRGDEVFQFPLCRLCILHLFRQELIPCGDLFVLGDCRHIDRTQSTYAAFQTLQFPLCRLEIFQGLRLLLRL